MKKIFLILLLVILLIILSPFTFGGRVGELTDVIKPAALAVDGNRLYITEGTAFHVYSLNPFKHIKKTGTKGEGPGEFKHTPYVNVLPDGLFVNNPGKIMFFSKDGDFQKETRLPFHYFYFNYPLLPVKDNYTCFQLKFSRETKGVSFEGKLYGSDFRFLKSFVVVDSPFLPPPPPPGSRPANKTDYDVIEECLEFTAADGKIFLADSRKGFFISVYDHNGNLLYEINNKYKKIKVPAGFEEEYMTELKKSPRWERLNMVYNFVFREYYPPFFSVKVKDGKIYALTYEKKEGKHEVVVLDLKGSELNRSFFFPLDPIERQVHDFPLYSTVYDISKGDIYYLVENEDTEAWELHREKCLK